MISIPAILTGDEPLTSANEGGESGNGVRPGPLMTNRLFCSVFQCWSLWYVSTRVTTPSPPVGNPSCLQHGCQIIPATENEPHEHKHIRTRGSLVNPAPSLTECIPCRCDRCGQQKEKCDGGIPAQDVLTNSTLASSEHGILVEHGCEFQSRGALAKP